MIFAPSAEDKLMITVVIDQAFRSEFLRLLQLWDASQRQGKGDKIGGVTIYPTEGMTTDGRLRMIGVPKAFLGVLRQQRMPFDLA